MNNNNSLRVCIIILAMLFAWTNCVYSLPKVDEVVSGEAEVKMVDPNTMQINATDNTIINYQSFNIMEHESVIISLPNSSSEILNRVIGPDRSDLFGNLSCNGIFILVNQNGIYVGPNANIEAASAILSTRDITDSDFIDGQYLFQKLSDEEMDMLLLNEGTIRIQDGGFGVLIAGAIENNGKIIAPCGKIVLAGGDAIKLNMSANGLISVAILEKTASKIYDHEGNPILDQIKNTGELRANGGAVILKAESVTDVFRSAINLEGVVEANRVEDKDGVISIVADNDVTINAEMAATSIDIKTEYDIDLDANIVASEGDILLFADYDGDGIGSFRQHGGLIEATGEGDIYIEGSGEMVLGAVKTELGAIKIGTQREPFSITGEPHYIHSKGDFEITAMDEGEEVTTLHTSRGDVLKYNTTGKVILEAADGRIEQLIQEPLPAGYLELKARTFDVNSEADVTVINDIDSNIYIEKLIEISEDVVSLEGETTGRVTYLISNDIVLQTPHDVDTAPGVIIPGDNVKITARRIGSNDSPVGISANLTYIHRIQGDIVISEIWGLGTTICIRGPDPDTNPDSWGAINLNKNTDLILEASQGGLFISENCALQAQNLTLIASQGIENYGSLLVENGTLTLTAEGAVISLGSLRAETLIEEGASFVVGGEYIVGYATARNADNAVTLYTGNYSGETSDTGDIAVKNNNIITLVGDTIFRADSDQNGVGGFKPQVGSSIVGGGYNLWIYGSESSTLRQITGVGTLSLYRSYASSNPYYIDYSAWSVGNLIIGAGISLDIQGVGLTLSGNFTNNGTFVSNNAVIFSGAGTSNITGNITFNNLTCTTAGKILKFKEGQTFTINGTLALTGTSGNEIVLDSQNGSTQFTFKVASAQSVSYIVVANSNVDDTSGGNITASNSYNDGNNDTGPTGRYWAGLPAATYSVYGAVYSDQGSTLMGAGVNIVLARNGVVTANTNTLASGQYAFHGRAFSANDVVLIYINNSTTNGNVVVIVDAARITGADIYGNTAIARHQTAGPVTNATFSTAKGSMTDTDIIYSVSGSNLELNEGVSFVVWTGDTYTPGGNLYCNDVVVQSSAIFNAAAGSTISASGDWANSGTFNPSTSTVILTGGSVQTLTSGGSSFNNLTIAGVGTYRLQDALNVTGTLAISGYSYKKAIVIDNTKVNADLTNFPVLFSVTDSDLAVTGSGGYVTSSNGCDIIFTDHAGVQLDHEVESYNPATGQIIAWVKVPSLSNSTDTTIYVHYGNSDIITSQENPTGVWSNGFAAVWHLGSSINDSTSNGITGTNNGTTEETTIVKVGTSTYFNGSESDYINYGEPSALDISGNNPITIETWVYFNSVAANYQDFFSKGDTQYHLQKNNADPGVIQFVIYDGDWQLVQADSNVSTGTWYHVVGTYNGVSGGALELYINGSKQTGSDTAASINNTAYSVYMGENSQSTGRYLDGYMDEARICNAYRTGGWIQTEHNNQSSPSTFYPNYTSEARTTGDSATLCLNGKNLSTATLNNTGTLRLLGAETVSITTMDTDSGLVDYYGDGSYTGLAAGDSYFDLTFSGTGVYTLDADLDINGDLSFTPTFQYRKEITIYASQVDADVTDFPVLFSVTDADLIDNLMHDANYTIKFTNATGTELPYEVEYYNNATGQLIAWVKADSLSSSTNTTLWLYYGSLEADSTEAATSVWSNNYSAVWHMSEASGTIYNSTSYPNNGTAAGGITYGAAGKIDGSVSLDGVDDRINCGWDPSLSPSNAITVSLWTQNAVSPAQYDGILGKTSSFKWDDGYGMFYNSSTEVRFYVSNYSANVAYASLTPTNMNYIVGTFDGSNVRIYVNGVEGTADPYAGTISSTAAMLVLGQLSGTAYNINGKLDEVRVAGTWRPSGWISTEFKNQNSPGTFFGTGSEISGGATINAGSYDINSAGDFDLTSGIFDAGTGTVIFDGVSTQTLTTASYDFYGLTVSNASSNGVQLADALTVTNALTISTNGVFDLQDNNMTATGAVFSNDGTLRLVGSQAITGLVMDTDSGTVEYTGDGDATQETFTIKDFGAIDYYHLLINDTNATTANRDIISVGVGTNLNVDGDLTVSGGTLNINGQSVNIAGNFSVSASPDARYQQGGGSDNTFDGSGNATIDTGGTDDDHDLTRFIVDKSGGAVLTVINNGVDINESLTITNGVLSLNGQNITTTTTFSNSGTLRLQGNESVSWTTNDTDSGKWEYVGDGDSLADTYTIKDFGTPDYYNLTINSTDGVTDTFQLGAALDVDRNLTITSGRLDANSQNINLAGNWIKTGGTFDSGTNTVTFDGGSAQTMNSGGTDTGSDFNNITVSGSTVQLIDNAVDIDGTLTINSGKVFDLNGQDFTLATLDNSGTLQLEGTETVAITTMDTDSGEVLYTGSGSYTGLAAGDNYYDLTFAGIGSYALDAALDVNGSLAISGYSYKKAIVLESDQVSGTADLTDFPVLFSVTDTDLRTTGNGGQVTDPNGYDIIFVDSNGDQLDHEVEAYNAATGQLIAWVKVSALDYNDDTTIYIYYGNSNITSSRENASGVWSNSYAAVYHLGEAGTGTAGDYQDSTSNSNDSVSTSNQPSQTTGKIDDYGQYFDGSEAIRIADASSLEPTSMTISCWFKRDGAQKDWTKIVHKGQGNSPFGSYILQLSADETEAEFQVAKTTPDYAKASSGTGAVADDTWYYLVGTYDGTTYDGILYINSANIDSFNDTAPLYYETTGLGIGGPGYNAYNDAAIGVVDEVRISSAVRTQGWITTEYNNQNTPSALYPTYTSGSGQTAGSAGTLDAAGYNMNIGGSWTNSGTFTHNNNTVIFDANDADNTITSGGSSFNNVTISSGTYAMQDAMVIDGNLTTCPWADEYSYRKTITIESDYVDADVSDFPMLFSVTDTDLIDNVMSGSNYTIKFTNSTGTELPYEVEYYNNGTGQLIAWVKADSLSGSTDTTLYLHYGSSGTASTENPSGVWSNGYEAVWHLTDAADSTGAGNDLTNTNVTFAGADPKIGDYALFDGDGDQLEDGDGESYINGLSAITVSMWVNSDITGTDRGFFDTEAPDGNDDVTNLRYDDAGASGGADDCLKVSINATTGEQQALESSALSQTTSWQYIVLTWSSGVDVALYLDGSPDTPSYLEAGASSGTLQNATTVLVGKGPKDGAAQSWDGLIDEVRVSSIARPSGWISTEHNNQDNPSAFHSTGSEGSSAPVLDLSGQNLTVTGTLDNCGTIKLEGGETVNLTMDTDSGLVEYYGAGSYAGLVAGDEYYDVKFSGSGNFDLDANLQINGDLNITGSVTGDAAGYSYYKTVTINYNYVDDDLTNFPMLFIVADSDLATVVNGGNVNSSSGYDIIFTDTSGNQLDHEIEKYDPETGEVVAWVRIPSLSGSVNTAINVHYGNGSVTASQENVSGVWGTIYDGVWHLNDDLQDSSSTANNGTNNGSADATGKIADGQSFNDAESDYIAVGSDLSQWLGSDGYVSLWINTTQTGNDTMWQAPGVTGVEQSGGANDIFYGWIDASGQIGVQAGNTAGAKSAADINDGAWHYIAMTRNATTGEVNMYVDDNTVVTATSETGAKTNAFYSFGRIEDTGGTPVYFNGTLDEIRVTDSIRPAEWISTEYNNQFSPGTFFGTGGETRNAPVLNAGSYNINIAGNYSQDEGTFVAPSSVLGLTGNFDLTGGTFNHNSGTIAFNATDTDNTLNLNGTAFNNVRFVNTATYALNSDLDVDGTLTFAQESGYGKEKTITIDHDLVAEDLTDFPILFSVTDGDLATVANGGDVANANGYDIIFTDANGTRLDHEIESYDPVSGQIVAWIKVPAVSAGADTVIYMKYGNDDITTSQENISGVWDSSFVGVWHMDETSGLVYDSTSYNNDGTVFAFALGEVNRSETGKIDGANDLDLASYPNDPAYILMTDSGSLDITGELTISAWINADDLTNSRTIVAKGASLTSVNYALSTNGTEAQFGFYNGGNRTYVTSSAGISTGTWYYVAATYDDAANSVKVYVNDTNKLDTSSTYSLIADNGNLNVSTYTYAPAGVYGFKGSIDEVRISNTDRSAGWLETEFNNQTSPAIFHSQGGETVPLTTIVLNNNDIIAARDFHGKGVTLSGAGGVVLDGSSTQSFDPGSVSLYNLTISNSSTNGVQVSDSLTVTNALTISSNGVLDLQDQDLTATGASFSNDGTLRLVGGQTITGLTMDTNSGTVEYYGNGSYTGLAAGNNYYNLYFSGDGSYALTGDLDVNNDLTFASYTWYDANWLSRIKITVSSSQVGENLADFPVYVDLSDLGSSFFSTVKTDGSDILVTEIDGTTVLKREVVDIDTTGETGELWFKASSLSSSTDTSFYIYYGNSNASLGNDTDVWSNSYLSAWHLEDANSDSTPNNHDLTDNSTSSVAGKIGGGQDFTAGAYLEDSNAEIYINGLNAFTLSLWANADAIGNDHGLVVSKTPDNADDDGINLRYDSAGSDGSGTNLIKGSAGTFGWPSSNPFRYESSSDTQSADWQYLTLAWSSGSQMALYVDGAADTPDYNSTARTTTITGATTFIIGKGTQDTTGGWEGLIDEVCLSNVARSAGWISTEYNNQNSPSSFYATGGSSNININTQGYNITVGGSFENPENVGSLSGSGTVIFDDATKASNILGDTIFYNFSCATAGKQLFFEASSTTTIQGTLTLIGGSGNPIILRSTSPNTAWNIDPQGARSVSYVDVQDSTNLDVTDIIATSSADSGRNTGWAITP